ncbi:MAG: hypothetical protein ACRDUV_12375, partial [Pseudonocardiaceae bacterium]
MNANCRLCDRWCPSATPANSPETDPEDTAPDPQLPTELPDLVRAITSASPTSRLAMRTHPTPVLALA